MKQVAKRTGQLLAVAAVGSMGVAHAYEWQISEKTTFGIGGSVELAYSLEDTGAGHANELIDNGSGISIFGEHAFTDSFSAHVSAEFDYNLDDISDGNGWSLETDHAYFGLRSNFGTLRIGDWDGIYDDNISDLIDFPEVNGPSTGMQTESGDSITYFSPEFNGLAFAVEGFFDGDDGISNNGQADGQQSFQAAIRYQIGRFGLHLAYDDMGYDAGQDGTLGMGATVDLAPFMVAAKVESVGADTNNPDGVLDAEGGMLYGVSLAYDYGHGMVSGLVQQVDPQVDGADGRTEFGINVTYDVADNFYVYVEHMSYDDMDGAGDTTATGLVYTF